MSTKIKVLLGAAVILTSFAFGRYTTPTKTMIQVKTVETVRTVIQKDTDQAKDTTITEVKKPDGTVTTVTHTTTETKTDTKEAQQDNKDIESTKTVTKGGSTVSLSMLAGINVTSPASGMVYGGMLSKQVLGPIGIGLFGLSNGVGGASIALSF
jgi:hypothetical protein